MKCPLCGAPECPNNEDWNDCDQNLLYAGAELLAALKLLVSEASGLGWDCSHITPVIDRAEGRGE